MKNRFNFKIVGSGPTGLLLAIALSKFDCNIFLTDLLTRDSLINKDKTYAITHSTRKILSKFRLWEKLEPYLFGFDTISISDSLTSVITYLSISDLDDDISAVKNVGWVVKHSDLMNVFFQEIDNYENIFFITPQKLLLKKILFDYQFFSTGANSLDKKFLDFLNIKKSYNQSCLTFKVSLRGNCEKRAYEIFRKEGPLALLPLDKNLYQVIWTSSTLKSIERLNSDKNFLMDNLSTILPNEFKLDQIIGDLNIFPVSLSLNFSIFNFKKIVLVGDAFHTFHPVGGQGLNCCWRDVNAIFDLFNKDITITKMHLTLFKFKYFSSRFLDIIFTMFITDSLILLFSNKNHFLSPIRKFSFLLLNNFLFIRKLVLNQMTKSLTYSRIK
ncbi:2-octaprenyl-6-methoxyphenol 4-monooxygenase [Prochlorococcus marinus str. MU1404]|uniref:FAD-dependent monooxygenase n=1 Tax=Prochlorococcus marinus TaxID=1219 RepID=UPI001ADCC8D3|nr:FAD-dependent monooxygenase [Prochlorococcus marinus]MBO8230191.1 2-octaprenyl-6-methoxyphenol 4-monooxygenase [Prochlorococcus marinus XMU1404]MBW3073038.1 2-octaprenyl-6-methoxyphenol 4-monooxygenase [Prochlorococcus marinus str. MU1404]MCR8545472.1 FAD-dependent monooxygenase [Prochlorococcus marinus CUG1432]